jgi:heme exporter protein A
MEPAAIDANGIGKRFGSRWALRGATCRIETGEVVGLFGANGSGKSTLLRILATLIRPNAGTALINGSDVVLDADTVRRSIGFLAHTPGLYDDLTAHENLRFAADMLGLAHASISEHLERVGLSDVANERVRGFSAGMQRRLAIARLRLARPNVLLLDEPYSNLDTNGIDLMNATIAELVAAGGAAIIALHEIAPAQRVLTRSVTLVNGRIN